MELSQAAISVPSRSNARILYAPPGQISTAAPLLFSGGAGKSERVGTVTSVIRFTGFFGVTGARCSGPIPDGSPGAAAGQTGSVVGSAASAAKAHARQPRNAARGIE